MIGQPKTVAIIPATIVIVNKNIRAIMPFLNPRSSLKIASNVDDNDNFIPYELTLNKRSNTFFYISITCYLITIKIALNKQMCSLFLPFHLIKDIISYQDSLNVIK